MRQAIAAAAPPVLDRIETDAQRIRRFLIRKLHAFLPLREVRRRERLLFF